MRSSNGVAEEYQQRAAHKRADGAREQSQFSLLGNLRLVAGIAAAVLGFFVFGSAAVPPAWLILPIGAFLILVVVHARVVERLECARRALRFYEQGLNRVQDRWMGAGEQGNRFRDPNHVYAEDLDLFGKGSLYELLCAVRTRAGEDTLAKWLLAPATISEVSERQAAVAELAPRLHLREDLALIGEDLRSGVHEDTLAAWAEAPPVPFPRSVPVAAAVLAAGTVLSLIAYLGGLSGRIPLLVFAMAQLTLAYVLRPRVQAVVHAADTPAHDLGLLAELLSRIEREPVTTPMLERFKRRLDTDGLPASQQIAKLERLATRLEWQHNLFFRPIAAMLMWSTLLAVAIEKWRSHSGRSIRDWIAVAGEFEALCALASYHYEHPSDPFPVLIDGPAIFQGEGLGHPLLASGQCVPNSIEIGSAAPLVIVSGSNMSGKSTFLRTVGLNTVLAWAGAPVRARRLTISPLQVGSSIRVQDSLQDGRSRFYAEITRLRQIVELTAGSLPVLFLLDELLSGTNSHDRRIGAAAIAKSLVERGAIGMLTTHDLALAHIAGTVDPPGFNVHFADTIEDGRLHFDYSLLPGVVERSNALELMRSVGLEV